MQDDKSLDSKNHIMPILSFAIDKVHEAVFLIDKEGKFEYVNEEACRMLGYDEEELLSLSVMKINPHMNQVAWSKHWSNLREHKTVIFFSEMKTKTDSLITVDINANYFIYNDKEYDLGLVRDITEHKSTELKLQKSEEQYRRLIETATEGIFIVQPNSYVSFANERIIQILGYTREELYSHPLTDILVPEEIQNHLNRIEKRRKLISEIYESRFFKKDGQIIWTRISATPIIDDDGNYTSSLAMISDITEKKKAEFELFKLNRIYKMLTECNEALILAKDEKNLLDTICNLMVDVGNYKMVWVGYAQNDEEKLIKPISSAGKDIDYLDEVKISWGDSIYGTGPGGKAIRNKEIQIVNNTKDLDLSSVKSWADGIESHQFLSCVVLPLIENDKAFGILTLYSDQENIFDKKEMDLLTDLANNISYGISGLHIQKEIKQLNQNLEKRVAERTKQLERLNKELEAFSYRVSHDLRSPIKHIESYIKLLQDNLQEQSTEKNTYFIDKIVESTKLMNQLINDILTLSKLDYQELTLTSIDLNDLLKDVIHDFKLDIGNRKINWEITTLPSIIADKSLIRLVFVNLLSNALKFTQKQAETVITIGSLNSNTENTIFVKDNGVGFDMQYSSKLFTAFQRLHSNIAFEGTGIGLANVQRIIKSHGGKTWAESEPNKGATFYFSLPLKKE